MKSADGANVALSSVTVVGSKELTNERSNTLVLPRHRATVSWRNLSVTAKSVAAGTTKVILKNAFGVVPPKSLCAIMGPSGSGKSTLLEAIAGRLPTSVAQDGSVLVNGHNTALTYGRSGFVTQDEVLYGVLTVRETILYAARLRVSSNPSGVADSVIEELGLGDCAATQVGTWYMRGLSGGQKRRVAIGCELVTTPVVLFLDEPTSGLDAAAAFHVTAVLKKLAGGGRTVVAVIHQPASETFELFDLLAVLAAGRTCYFGAAQGAAPFFETALKYGIPAGRSAADHLLHTVNGDFGDAEAVAANIEALIATYPESSEGGHALQAIDAAEAAPGFVFEPETVSPNAIAQTRVLVSRAFYNNLRDLSIFWMRIVMYVMLCVMMGFVYFKINKYWQNVFPRAALLWFVISFLTFMSVAAFPSFCEDFKVFLRERLNGYYGVGQFVVSNTIASLPFIFLISFVSSPGVYFIAGLDYNPFEKYVYFVLELFMALVVVESMMVAIAPLVPHFLMGIAAGAGIHGMFMIVTGFVQPTNQLPKPILLYPLHWFSFQTYAWFGLMHNEFDNTAGWGCQCATQPGGCSAARGGASCTVDGRFILDYWAIPHQYTKWGVCFGVLVAWTFFYRFLFYVACKYKERR